MKRRRYAAAVVAALIYTMVAPLGAAPASARLACWKTRDAESAFAAKINSARRADGKGSLILDPELSQAARSHTYGMKQRSLLYHTPSDRLRWKVTNWVMLGENVGVGGSVDSLHTAFMNSPAHRDNILQGGFVHVGVGTVRDGAQMWVTVIFEAKTNPGTRLPSPC